MLDVEGDCARPNLPPRPGAFILLSTRQLRAYKKWKETDFDELADAWCATKIK